MMEKMGKKIGVTMLGIYILDIRKTQMPSLKNMGWKLIDTGIKTLKDKVVR